MNEKSYSLEIFDTASMGDFWDWRKLVFPGTTVFIICYSVVQRYTLKNVLTFYHPETVEFMDDPVIILVGNKLDLAIQSGKQYIDPEEAVAVAKTIGAKASFQCSAFHVNRGLPGNVDIVFMEAIRQGLKSIHRRSDYDNGKCCMSCVLT